MNTNACPPVALSDEARVKLTVSCRDCDLIPKHPLAGQTWLDADGSRWQVMHNGILVEYGGYYGEWMASVIRELKGHHEPQEELIFHQVMRRIGPDSCMIELGAYWAYYSAWFKHDHHKGRVFMFEPDPGHLAVGKRNFSRNGYDGYFEIAAGGIDGQVNFYCETEALNKSVKSKSVDTICAEHGIDYLDVLHLDIQGAELLALQGAEEMIAAKKLRFAFVSTHHHIISGDPLTHQKCIQWLLSRNAHVICSHSVHESYSGDGLIVASFSDTDRNWSMKMSLARASESLFRELEYDLAARIQDVS